MLLAVIADLAAMKYFMHEINAGYTNTQRGNTANVNSGRCN